jgi:ribosome maturation factor RimP
MTDRLHDALAPLVSDLGLDLYDLEVRGNTVIVTVDRPGGIDLEALAAANQAVSRALDELDPMSGRYTLEVTSPGLERKLRAPSHFKKAVGETVTVRTHGGATEVRRVTGKLTAADDDGIELEGPEVPEGSTHIDYGQIERARTVFAWGSGPAPSPSKAKTASRVRPGGKKAAGATTERVTTP